MNRLEFNQDIDFYIRNYEESSVVLRRIQEQVNKIYDQIIGTYSLVFIAEKGAGKTTTLDYLLGLTVDKEKINEKNGRTYIVEQDVLETGSGATTTSEVEITQSIDIHSRVVVIPYEKEEMEDILHSFAKIMFRNAHDINDSEEVQLATELIRACRNMTGLTEQRKTEKKDLARELALSYKIDEYEMFQKKVVELALIGSRTQTEFHYDEKIDEKMWIKKIFRRLNLVKEPNAPLPKKIIIKLSKRIFDFGKLGKVERIVDTRGLEIGSITDRIDIKKIFREEQNNIVLLVDKFNSPSKSIIDLMEHYVYDKNMECVNRIGYIVNFRDGEPEKVIGCDGNVETEIEGKEEKLSQVIQIFKENNVYINNGNIIYSNPKRFIDDEGRVKVSIDDVEELGSPEAVITHKKEIRESERQDFIDEVLNIMKEYELNLEKTLNELMIKYDRIKKEIHMNSSINIQSVIEFINKEALCFDVTNIVAELYDSYIRGKFPSTLMAINNRSGIYNYYDIFCEGASIIEDCIRKKLQEFKDSIIEQLYAIEQVECVSDIQKDIIDFTTKDINEYFYQYISKVNDYFYKYLKDVIFNVEDVAFWKKVRSRWGRGNGYRVDVAAYYRQQIEELKFSSRVNNDINVWIEALKKEMHNIVSQINQ